MKKLIVLFALMIVSSAFADVRLSNLSSSDISLTVIDPVTEVRWGRFAKGCWIEADSVIFGLARGHKYEPKDYNITNFRLKSGDEVSLNELRFTVLDSKRLYAFGILCLFIEDSFKDLNAVLEEVGLRAKLKR